MRKEKDALGEIEVPADSYGGSFHARAKSNFQISTLRSYQSFSEAICNIKMAAANVNPIEKKIRDAIVKAGNEFLSGKFDSDFDLDIYQAGAGTPFNMNLNEILANRANEILGGKKGEYKFVHPNDHVNMSQSSNDVIPTAIRLAALNDLEKLSSSLKNLIKSFEKKEKSFSKIWKCGRTHLQDAVPITMGQEFGGYKESLISCEKQIKNAREDLLELGIGGTAIGSGINTPKDFSKKMCSALSKVYGLKLKPAKNLFQKTNSMNSFLLLSSSLRSLAVELLRISNDLRIMASGPVAGFNELVLPEVEPGSSIMPGKVNPSIPECMSMISIQVIGLDQSISLACQQGQFELNWHTPLIMTDLLHQIEILGNGMKMFGNLCIDGLKANDKEMLKKLNASTCFATAYAPKIGYKEVARLVKESLEKGVPFNEIFKAE